MARQYPAYLRLMFDGVEHFSTSFVGGQIRVLRHFSSDDEMESLIFVGKNLRRLTVRDEHGLSVTEKIHDESTPILPLFRAVLADSEDFGIHGNHVFWVETIGLSAIFHVLTG